MNKNLLSVLCLIVFFLMATASAVNKIHYNAFKYSNRVEEPSEKGNYLVMNDGSRIYGTEINWQHGLLVKDLIKIDGQKYKINEVIGYRQGHVYYGRLKNDYIKRIVHGKVNVYVKFTEVTNTSTDRFTGSTRTRSYTRTDHYAQKGELGVMTGMAGQKEIKEVVSECPLAVEMANLSNAKMRKAIKADANYLNSIFETYNNDCKPVKQSLAARQ
jgi:hypothetical protein